MNKTLSVEIGELGTHLPLPTKETSIIIPIVAKQAITLENFIEMFFTEKIYGDAGTLCVKKKLTQGKSTAFQNRTFLPAEKEKDDISYLKNSPWSPNSPTKWEGHTVGQYYDFSRLGGHDQRKSLIEPFEDHQKILLAYAHDNGQMSFGEFGRGTFKAQRDILKYIAKKTGLNPRSWDMASRTRIYDKLFNLQIHRLARNLHSKRTLKELDNFVRYHSQKITKIFPVKNKNIGNGAEANFYIFINVRLNLFTKNFIILRIRYPIMLQKGEQIGGIIVSPD